MLKLNLGTISNWKMVHCRSVLILLLLVPLHFSPALLLQNTPFQVDIESAQFRYKSDSTYVEIYYSYDESQLTFNKKDEKLEGALLINIKVFSTIDNLLKVDTIQRILHVVNDTSHFDQGKSFVGVIGLTVPKGEYIMRVKSFDDHNRAQSDSTSCLLPEKSFEDESIALSDIELCSSIRKIPKDPKNTFYKNTFEVIPNPSGIYSVRRPIIFFYLEAYNLFAVTQYGTYHTKVAVYDSNNHEVKAYERKKRRIHESSVEIGSLNVSSLPGGLYTLVFTLIDSSANQIAESAKRFFIHTLPKTSDRSLTTTSVDVIASEYSVMNEEELDKELALIQYIASDMEISHYPQQFSIDAKREFLFNFWKNRDPKPQTPINEFKQEYMRRVQYANTHLRSSFRKGWQTDRGRVYLVYGIPDEHEYHTYETFTKPYVVWYYHNIQGGVIFVFADLSGFHDYELVHSTHRSELHNYNWKSLIQK